MAINLWPRAVFDDNADVLLLPFLFKPGPWCLRLLLLLRLGAKYCNFRLQWFSSVVLTHDIKTNETGPGQKGLTFFASERAARLCVRGASAAAFLNL
jgi:hypothetical protein